MLSEKFRFIRSGVPNPLVILATLSIVGGVVAAVVFGFAYLGYDAPEGDENVKMDMTVTGVIVCAFFLSYVTLGIAVLRGKTWGVSAAVVTTLVLIPVAWSLFTSGQPAFGIALVVVIVLFFGLVFNPTSKEWIDSQYDIRQAAKDARAVKAAKAKRRR
jgi:hypothetical protein